ncbi:MAG: class I SAM-dependent methyltransferase [Candidatus Kapabacteria bacterium]|nr:class I SAM-dependent methyltransferase [Candidatus Kapabacteria bacterium]
MFLCACIEETRNVKGSIAEVGCFIGATTIFLNKYMDARNIEKDYRSVDTFNGFVEDDIQYEVENRGKVRKMFSGFKGIKKEWYDQIMRDNEIKRVHSTQADINRFDLTSLGQLSFVLLDVDLYRPMKKGLKELYEVLAPGGVMVLDDCDASSDQWDGSDQAYKEFMKERNMEIEIVHGKLGVIRKPVA